MRVANYVALTLVIIGALNWGLIGFFGYDVVTSLFGGSMFQSYFWPSWSGGAVVFDTL